MIRRSLRRRVLLGALLLVSFRGPWPAGSLVAAGGQDEYQVKAAFLLNFVKYVEWPSGSFGTGGRITVVMLGGTGAARMEEWLRGKTAQGTPLAVRRVGRPSDIGAADVLFVGPDALSLLGAALDSTAGRPVLTITEDEEGGVTDAVINLFVEDGRVAFAANLDAAASRNLRLSSRLCSLARTVRRGIGQPR